jgi:hypothetical protein
VNIVCHLDALILVSYQAGAVEAFLEDSMTSVVRQERAEVVLGVPVAVVILDQGQLGE